MKVIVGPSPGRIGADVNGALAVEFLGSEARELRPTDRHFSDALWPDHRDSEAYMVVTPIRFETQSKSGAAWPAFVGPAPASTHT